MDHASLLDEKIEKLRIKNSVVQQMVRQRDDIEHIKGLLESTKERNFYIGTENHSVYCKVPEYGFEDLKTLMGSWIVTLELKIAEELDKEV